MTSKTDKKIRVDSPFSASPCSVWPQTCGECRHLGGEWVCETRYCQKIDERRKAFREGENRMNAMDAFRFSPDAGMRPGFKACQFFEPNVEARNGERQKPTKSTTDDEE